ncbi:hypothetical protein [Peribacillus frigoritolerans]|uniref:hypothetical protein n=1 Tax=Peribacillus frigoritolerans TaxID=450367 RepID=UPI002415C755|nr:hypothetical protein [Peribacillus frigoritolerans]MDG4850617.1 hypothetical protein [Peribacillus frigoritolerans]
MKTIQLSYEGTVFNKIAGNDKKAMFYNEELNNLLIVTTDKKTEMQKMYAEELAEQLKNGEIEADEVSFNEHGEIEIELDDEDFNDTIEDALGFIVGDRWDDLCMVAEYAPNVTIEIHKPYHTTTDFTVNYDLNPQDLLNKALPEAIEAFDKAVPDNVIGYKLIEVMNGKAYRYGEIPEEVMDAHC